MNKIKKGEIMILFAVLSLAIYYVTAFWAHPTGRFESYYNARMIVINILFMANIIADAIILHIPDKTPPTNEKAENNECCKETE